MRSDRRYLLSMRKDAKQSQLACYVKDYTEKPVPLMFKLGEMEGRPKLTDDEYRLLIEQNRSRYSALSTDQKTTSDTGKEAHKQRLSRYLQYEELLPFFRLLDPYYNAASSPNSKEAKPRRKSIIEAFALFFAFIANAFKAINSDATKENEKKA
jgi:hypothetical protein